MWRNRILFAPEGLGGGGDAAAATAAAAAAAAAAAGKSGGDASWRDGLPDTLKSHAGLGKFKDIPSLAEGYINAEKLIGSDKLVVPGKDAKPEEWDAVYDKLGRPKTADEYVIPEVKDRPYTDADKALQGAFKPIAHKLGLNASQVAGLVEWQTGLAVQAIAAQTKAAGDSEAALRKTHGDKYDAFMEKANVALEAALKQANVDVGVFRNIKLADGTFAGDNAMMVSLFAAMGDAMGETGFEGGGGGKGDAFSSPAAAAAELNRLKGGEFTDPKHPYRNKRHPDHKNWSDRVMRMQSLASQVPAKK